MNNFSKKMVSGADIIAEYGGTIFDSNGKRILSDVNYVITVITIDNKEKIIIRDVDSDYDSVVLMRLMLYAETGFDNIIKISKEIDSPFEKLKYQIEEMIDKLVENENYESASKLKSEWENYLNNINKPVKKNKRKSK